MKNTLPTIAQKFSDVRVVQSELEAMMQGPRREAITMMFLVIANIPLLYFLNKVTGFIHCFLPLREKLLWLSVPRLSCSP